MVSFKSLLSGPKAFYKLDYEATTMRDFESPEALPSSYVWNSESKIRRIARRIFSILFFPIFVHKLLHNLVGKIIVPAATPSLIPRTKSSLNRARAWALEDTDWKYKRLTLEVDGIKIDAVIMGKKNTLANRTWTLVSGGNGEFYEDMLAPGSNLKELLSKSKSNAIVFNYPGVGASKGAPNRQAMANAYRAALCFPEEMVQAKKIIGFSHSIGGGVQSDALNSHTLSDKVKYVFVKGCTFSPLAKEVNCMISKNFGFFWGTLLSGAIHALGWNMNPLKTSKKLAAKEIILQTCSSEVCTPLTSSHAIISDGVIPADASLAKALLEDTGYQTGNKVFYGIPEWHNEPLREETVSALASKIKEALSGR